ncbi:MAG TPA: exodeoxyribonuclease VII small subunit [Patescibacteria group bacterium]|nr:exodeoxyribonuclease VII small subunit [Patescibacteria group bacterium]
MSQPLTFEEALTKLEQITSQIEKGDIGLDEAISSYEKAISLYQLCREKLSKAEIKIKKLTSQMKEQKSIDEDSLDEKEDKGQEPMPF